MEGIDHDMLECGAKILKTKRHDSIGKSVCRFGCSRRIYPSGRGLHGSAGVDDLIDRGCGKVVFWTCPIQIMEIGAYTNGPLFLGNMDRVQNLGFVFNGKDKLSWCNLYISALMVMALAGCISLFIWEIGGNSSQVSI